MQTVKEWDKEMRYENVMNLLKKIDEQNKLILCFEQELEKINNKLDCLTDNMAQVKNSSDAAGMF